MADIGSLIIKISADASELESAFHKMGGSAKQFGQSMDTISTMVQTAFFAATSAAVAMTIQAGKTAEETDQLAQKTGIAAASLEGMSVVMARNGLTSQSMAMAIKGLSKEMIGVQQGTASSIKLFEDLGVSLDVVGKGTGATLRAIADRFKELPDGAMKAKAAVDLFGRAGLDWIPILNKGGEALDESMKKSAEFGLILSDTARNQLTVFDDAMDDLMQALKGFGMQVGIAFAPSMTIIVNAFTDAIVFLKNVFNQLSDAGTVLSVRFAAMVASIQVMSNTLFSLNAFSKEAWTETMKHVEAIDAWAAAEIQGVASARAAGKELEDLARKQLDAAAATDKHTSSQKTLGEQIVKFTQIQQQLKAEEGKKQERMGADVLGRSKVEEEIKKQEGIRQVALGHQINANFAATQEHAQAWVDAYMIEENAMTARWEAEIASTDKAEENTGRWKLEQIQAANAVKGFWTTQLEALVASNAFSVATITTTWTSGIANSIVNGGNFIKAAWQSTQIAIIQGGLNLAIQWAAQQALMASASGAAATFTAGVWGGATAAITGFFAMVTGAFTTMIASMTAIITAVGEYIMGVLTAIAEALGTNPFTVAWVAGILIGIALIAAALAATGNLGFKEGGIGDFGSGTPATLHGHEAIIPLDSRGADFLREAFGMGGSEQAPIHTHVYIDGREVALAVSNNQMSSLRTMGVLQMLIGSNAFSGVSFGSLLNDNGSLGPGPLVMVEINGINANNFIQVNTLTLNDTIGQPMTCNFTSINDNMVIGDQVEVFFEVQLLFSGTINRRDHASPDLTTYFNSIEAVDWSHTLIRRKTRRAFTEMGVADIVQSILDVELLGEEMTQGLIDNDDTILPLVDSQGANNARVFDVLRDIAGATGQTFYVDFDKSIQMRSTSNAPAPILFNEANVLLANISSITDRETYRNRQTTVVTGTPAAGVEPNVVTLTQDNAAQQAARQAIEGGTGIYEEIEEVTHPTSNDATDLNLLAIGYNALLLSISGVPRVTIRCRVRSYGIRAGQIATVDLPTFGIAGEFVIQRATINVVGGQELFHDLELTASSAQQRAYESWLSIVREGKVIVQIPSAITTNNLTVTTPGTSTWTVPGGVTLAVFTSAGASGGGGGGAKSQFFGASIFDYANGGVGGNSGKAVTVLTVIPGQVYDIVVGAAGTGGASAYNNDVAGAFGASGTAGTSSQISRSGTLVCVGAGGGGGGGAFANVVNDENPVNGANGTTGGGTGDTTYIGGGVVGGAKGTGNPFVNGANGADGYAEVNW